ncbi:LacI family DNA-binding transcriptional regulator [Christiangramia sp. SM2212]|uniref:LacI family DNA-binding transcriptional regulator n=1 Tax=Christiangramia sediminicola TaxID=3073267 RepID=A0ABU1EKW7_9FLAO|nr:LacI family DNA-binding transcriptional regulator [Christiangramia sp. SM2212]MDR5589027.1 LacI family DNA-binding transcriptional regulator [Christiangramia sp. SM2212]
MKSRTTLKELSKLLNLSISTVSKSLNDSSEISSKTKQRVRDTAFLHNYIPNDAAKSLKNRQSNIIGVVIPSLKSTFSAALLEGIEAKADEMNYKVFLCISNNSVEKEKECIKRFLETQVDGVIVFPTQETQESGDITHLNELINLDVPLVIFDSVTKILNCDKVSMENSLQTELAVNELNIAGCSKIAFITQNSEACLQQKYKDGYCLAVEKLNLPAILIEDTVVPFHKIAGMIKNKRLDGIIACSRYSAGNLLKKIRNTDSQIIKNIPVVALSNGNVSRNFLPNLSSLDQKGHMQGKLAVETLLNRIHGKLPLKRINFQIKSEILQC